MQGGTEKGYIEVSNISEVRSDPGPQHRFSLVTPKRTYYIAAPSEEEKLAWIRAIELCIAPPSTKEQHNITHTAHSMDHPPSYSQSTHAVPTYQPPMEGENIW